MTSCSLPHFSTVTAAGNHLAYPISALSLLLAITLLAITPADPLRLVVVPAVRLVATVT
jgi:hypothetical protein